MEVMARRKQKGGLPKEKSQALQAIRKDPTLLKNYSRYRDDEEFVLALIDKCLSAPVRFRTQEAEEGQHLYYHNHPEKALREWATPRFCKNEALALKVVEKNWRALLCLIPSLQANHKIVLQALNFSEGNAFQYAAEELRSDKKFVLQVAGKYPLAWQFAAAPLKEDHDLCMEVLRTTSYATLQFMSETYRDDSDIVLAAIQWRPDYLRFASERLRGDPTLVQIAVERNGSAIEHASEGLRSNRDLMFTAVQNSGYALQFCLNSNNDRLLNDEELVKAAVSNHGDALKFASDSLKNNREIVKLAIQNSLSAVQYASEELRADREISKLAIAAWPDNIQYVTCQELKNDKNVATMLLQREIGIFQYLPENLQNDVDVVCRAMETDFDIFLCDYWQEDDHARISAPQEFCLTLKARLVLLAEAVDEQIVHNSKIFWKQLFPLDSPFHFAKAWLSNAQTVHSLLGQPIWGMENGLPAEVRNLIWSFSRDVQMASELLHCANLIDSFVNQQWSEDWIAFLHDHENLFKNRTIIPPGTKTPTLT